MKTWIVLLLLIFMVASPEAAGQTPDPSATHVPAVTHDPGVTQVPAVTHDPGVTQVPAITHDPGVTQVPVVTKAPAGTDVPKGAARVVELSVTSIVAGVMAGLYLARRP